MATPKKRSAAKVGKKSSKPPAKKPEATPLSVPKKNQTAVAAARLVKPRQASKTMPDVRADGEFKRPDNVRHCLTCRFRIAGCRDPKRSQGHLHRCSKWRELPIFDLDMDMEAVLKLGAEQSAARDAAGRQKRQAGVRTMEDVVDLVKDTLNSDLPIMPDLRLDDRDFPSAKNFYEWLNGKSFANSGIAVGAPLWAKQLEVLATFTSEVCPHCSDMGYLADVPLKDTNSQFLGRVTLLEHGVCPKCQATKAKMVSNGELHDPTVLVGVAGQRCLEPLTLLLTDRGMLSIGELAAGEGVKATEAGFHSCGALAVSNESAVHKVSRFYVSPPDKLLTVRTDLGARVAGSKVHPMLVGWESVLYPKISKPVFKEIRHLKVGDVIPVFVGQEVWAHKTPSLRLVSESANAALSAAKAKFNYKPLRVNLDFKYYAGHLTEGLAELIGWYVAEGNGGAVSSIVITNGDRNMLCRMKKAAEDLFGKGTTELRMSDTRSTNFVIPGKKAWFYFNEMFDGKINRKSGKRFTPRIIREAPRRMVIAYLRALFEGGGGVLQCRKSIVSFCSISRKLAEEVRLFLSNIGIISRVHRKATWATNGTDYQISKTAYTVDISGLEQLKLFRTHVGFLSDRKSRELNAAIEHQSSLALNMPHFYDKYPEEVKQEFIAVFERCMAFIKAACIPHPGTLARKRNRVVGHATIFGNSKQEMRIHATNVALSRQCVLKTFGPLLPYSRCFDADTKRRFAAFIALAQDQRVYFDYVSSVKRENTPRVSIDLTVPVGNRFLANGLVAHNSGKTSTITAMESYYIHRFVKMPNPQRAFGVLPQQTLIGTYVALTWTQAQKNIWIPLNNIIKNSPWFTGYHEFLDSMTGKFGDKDLYRVGEDVLAYAHRNLRFSLASANMRTLRGDTRIAAIIDELGLWPFGRAQEGKERANGPEIYKSMENQLPTAEGGYEDLIRKGYSDIPKPHLCAISSPMDINDTIMTKYREAEGDPRFYTFKRTTWEFNPKLPLETKFLQSRLRSDPDAFWRDYGAVPPLSSSGWITEIDNVVPLFAKKRSNAAKLAQKVVRTAKGSMRTTGVLQARALPGGRLLTLDAGVVNNHFAACVSHLEPNPEDEEALGTVVVDALVELIPSAKAPISFNSVFENVIKPLVAEHGVQVVLADHWQSESILSALEDQGLFQKKVRLKYDHFSAARADFYDRRIQFPKLEMPSIEDIMMVKKDDGYPQRFMGKPVAHLLFQIMSVRDIVGKTVEKGSGSTDDLFRAVILAHWGLRNPEIVAMLKPEEERFDAGFFGLVKGGSAGQGMQNHLGSTLSLPKLGDSGGSGGGGGKTFIRSDSAGGQPSVFGIARGMR